MATTSAMQTWRQVFQNPQQARITLTKEARVRRDDYMWAWYDSTLFDRISTLSPTLKEDYRLYRQTRLIYNPVTRCVDFWAGIIYPGVLSHDGRKTQMHVPLAIPMPDETPPQLVEAIAQAWNWTNWQSNKNVMCRYAAIAGNTLVEVVDDGGKVGAQIYWPSLVKEVVLNSSNRDVKSYTLEYSVKGPRDDRPYLYRKEVDGETYRTYKNDARWDYTNDTENGMWEWENTLGFAPAVWVKHKDIGGVWGVPAMAGVFPKLLELNSLASHVHDQMHKKIGAPKVLWSNDTITNLLKTNTRREATDTLDVPESDRDSVLLLKGGQGGRVDDLAGDLNLADALQYLDRLIAEIEKDRPELAAYPNLRAQSEVTGPAAQILNGDVRNLVWEARGTIDPQMVKLQQMWVTFGAVNASDGTWRAYNLENGAGSQLTPQQQKFKPFDLASYKKGELDHWIMERDVIPEAPPSPMERAQIAQIKAGYGVSNEMLQKEDGYTDEQIAKMKQQKAEADAARLAMANLAFQGGGDTRPDTPGSDQPPRQRGTQSSGGQQVTGKAKA